MCFPLERREHAAEGGGQARGAPGPAAGAPVDHELKRRRSAHRGREGEAAAVRRP